MYHAHAWSRLRERSSIDSRLLDLVRTKSRRVLGFVGHSNSGKTTIIEKIVRQLVTRDLKVSVIKHARHGFDIDTPGKDSYRHREAGCHEVLVMSNKRWVLMRELEHESEPSLEEQLSLLAPCDVVLIEGFKNEAVDKIEVHRRARGGEFLYRRLQNVVAIATDADMVSFDSECPKRLDMNSPDQIVEFILTRPLC